MHTNEPKLLRVEEAAEFLNVKPSTIRAWLLRRKVACVRVGQRAIRIPRSELEALIASGTLPARGHHNGK